MFISWVVLFTLKNFVLADFIMHFWMVVMNLITIRTELIIVGKLIYFENEVLVITLPSILVIHKLLKTQLIFCLFLNKLCHLIFSLDLFHSSQLWRHRIFCMNLDMFLFIIQVSQLVNVTSPSQCLFFLLWRTKMLKPWYSWTTL